jgi:Zn-dependent M28 family amino/carboxypeptidase
MKLVALFTILLSAAGGQGIDIDGGRIRAHTRFLASDLLEGRGVGARGGDLATEYLATQLSLAGVKPAGENGSYFQRVPLVGVETQADSSLVFVSKQGTVQLKWLDDFVGGTQQQQPRSEFDSELVFAGHGITAPEFGWDDYRGTDVRGKVVAVFTNEPPSKDAKFFGGPALTYYGRWTYKYENALRHGALGAIIIHTTPTAGYGWDVLRSSGRESPQVKLAAGAPALAFSGWVTADGGAKAVMLGGRTLEELLEVANAKGFRAFPLGVRVRGEILSKVREIETRNVVGIVPGSDADRTDEAVIFTAHWDHLGVGEAVKGDRIYNGAVDNATGCATILEIARAWAALQRKPGRSALFVFFTAEEAGLLGATYYADHAPISPGKTAFGINIDGFYPAGRTRDIVLLGAERSTVWQTLQDIARQMSLTARSDPRPEQGSYYRSDHFALAHVGIPAVSVKSGADFERKPADFGSQIFREYNTQHYHQPSDEYQDDWDFAGLERAARFSFALGASVADLESIPTWQPGDEFLPAREKSLGH